MSPEELEGTQTDEALEGTPAEAAGVKQPSARTIRRRRQKERETDTTVRAITDQPTFADVSRKKQQATTGWSDSDIEALQLLAGSLLMLATGRIASLVGDDDLRASQQEIDVVSEALARIICRHLRLKAAKKGDLADILAIGAATVAYVTRVWDTKDRRKHAEGKALTSMYETPAPNSNGSSPSHLEAVGVEAEQDGFTLGA